jgi:hypothetical protein
VVLAPRGLREEDDGRTHGRVASEFVLAVQGQARKVWIETAATTVVVTAAALAFALLR